MCIFAQDFFRSISLQHVIGLFVLWLTFMWMSLSSVRIHRLELIFGHVGRRFVFAALPLSHQSQSLPCRLETSNEWAIDISCGDDHRDSLSLGSWRGGGLVVDVDEGLLCFSNIKRRKIFCRIEGVQTKNKDSAMPRWWCGSLTLWGYFIRIYCLLWLCYTEMLLAGERGYWNYLWVR